MRFDKFTVKSQTAIEEAISIARDLSHQEVGADHLLLALLKQEDGVAGAFFGKLGVPVQSFISELEGMLADKVKVEGDSAQVYFSNDLHHVLRIANKETTGLGDEYVSSEHILLAILQTRNGSLQNLLKRHNILNFNKGW